MVINPFPAHPNYLDGSMRFAWVEKTGELTSLINIRILNQESAMVRTNAKERTTYGQKVLY